MPLIHSDGLFDGDRINSCSPMAQLHYPRIMCAANGYGRINLDYMQLISKVFPKWKAKDIPSKESLMGYIKEYSDNRLLYVYRCHGQIWGQWDAKPGTFGKYQTTEDKRSPAPPEADFLKWLEDNRKSSVKISEPCGNFAEILREGMENLPHGVGVVIGDGVTCEVIGKRVKPSSRCASTDALFDKAYEQYPRHIGKRAAKKAWENAVNRVWGELEESEGVDLERAKELVYQRVMTYAAVCERAHKEKQFIPHMATWLNQDRFMDDPSEWAVNQNGAAKKSKLQENLDALDKVEF